MNIYLIYMNLNLFLLISSIFGILLVTIFLTKKNINKISSFFLASFYFIFSIYCIQTYIIESSILSSITWFYGWPLIIYSLTPVTIYFYFISVLTDNFKWKRKYIILFIPFLLSCIDVFILYFKPRVIYDHIILEAIINPRGRFEAQYGFFTLLQHFIIRHIFLLVYLIILFPTLRKFINWNRQDQLKKILNTWLTLFFTTTFTIALLSSLLGIEDFFHISIFGFIFKTKQVYFSIVFLIYLFALFIGIAPLYFPSILYGFPQTKPAVILNSKKSVDKTLFNNKDKYGLNELEIIQKLELIVEKEFYLQNQFDLNQLSALLELPVHHLSYFINQHYKISFATYRNHLRMEYAKKMILSGYLDQNTIEALAWKCGFSSRSAFTKTFKSFTNCNPSEYKDKITD